MAQTIHWPKVMFTTGVVLLIAGALDPLEGSPVVALGSMLLAVSAFKLQDAHRRLFTFLSVLICTGVAVMWYISSLGGFHPKTGWGWWIGIAPYPVGWLATLVLLMVRWAKKR